MLPADAQKRKDTPMVRGLLDYFPDALAEVARVSKIGNDQHNPGEDMHWARGKSTDHADCIVRHLVDRGLEDSDGVSHTAKVAWRALALLQEELEDTRGLPLPRGAQYVGDTPSREPPSAVPPPAASVDASSEAEDPGARSIRPKRPHPDRIRREQSILKMLKYDVSHVSIEGQALRVVMVNEGAAMGLQGLLVAHRRP